MVAHSLGYTRIHIGTVSLYSEVPAFSIRQSMQCLPQPEKYQTPLLHAHPYRNCVCRNKNGANSDQQYPYGTATTLSYDTWNQFQLAD